VGLTQTFVAIALNASNSPIPVRLFFQSSNPAVVTIASNGLACAGSWDSLTNPVVCTPGSSGQAQITATAQGVSSPPVTMYVHQHVDSVTIAPVTPPTAPCLSKDLTFDYAARAFSRGMDITATVGPFVWQTVDTRVVTLDNTVTGLAMNQVESTAKAPGDTQIFATVAGVHSQPFQFETCLVKSIALAIEGTSGNSFSIPSGSKTLTPTVLDSQDVTITDVSLTWSSSEPTAFSVSPTGLASAARSGTSTIIASCTPPTCNIGTAPTRPIYPEAGINATVTGTPRTTIAWVATKGCIGIEGCTSTIVPIAVPGNTVGTGLKLPGAPNSLLFNRQGTAAYLGGSRGLMIFSPSGPSLTLVNSVTGRVLAISPDGKKVIVSDTSVAPNLVSIVDTTGNPTLTYPITGATAADFSPDSLKAYIVANDDCGASTLYVDSTDDAFNVIPLSPPQGSPPCSPPLAPTANDVSFLPVGAFAYLAGGSPLPAPTPPAVSVRTTCTNLIATDSSSNQQILPTATTPAFIRALPNATQVLAVESPGIDVISVTTTPVDCPPTVSNTVQFVNLGQGPFEPVQFIVAPDSSKAYLLTSNLGSVVVYNVAGQNATPIQLAANATPVQASLVLDGSLLYVAGSDGTVHVVDVAANRDTAQISFPENLCNDDSFNCKPDLIAIQP
jgi:hypothetical protein